MASSKEKKQRAGSSDLVLTPGGWRKGSRTVKVEPGQHVEVKDGHLCVLDTATGTVVVDLGEVKPNE